MIKMTQLITFAAKGDAIAFYRTMLKPLLQSMPGMLRFETSEIIGLPLGAMQPQLLVDMYFLDEQTLDAAFASAEGRQIVRELSALGGKNVEAFESLVIDPPA